MLLLLSGCLEEKFSGIAPEPYPAPGFTLKNQNGEEISLQDLRGKIVVMSFMYTGCPTVCPLITTKFLEAANMLGESAGREVVFIGVTVDPERDTPEAVKTFLESKGMQDKMHFLIGERKELETVWENYNVYVNRSGEGPDYTVDHTAIVYVIDKNGDLRILYPGLEWFPKFLVSDIKTLMREDNPLFRIIYSVPK